MSNTQLKILLAVAAGIIIGLLIQPKEEHRYSEQEVENINSALSQRFNNSTTLTQKALPTGHPMTASSNGGSPAPSSMTRKPPINVSSGIPPMMSQGMPGSQNPVVAGEFSIIGIIYKREQTTWFFKAKDKLANIERINNRFKKYFLDGLTFNGDEPDLSQIPESMKVPNTSTMRVATFMLDGVEISVSRLNGQQNVFANVQRWMRQIGMTDNSAIQLDFKDNKKTLYVRLPRPKSVK